MGIRQRISESIAEVRTRSQKLVQLNIELLKAELRKRAQEYGVAIGMMVAGGLLAFYALGFALATITVLLALVLPLWLSLLIVTLALCVIIAILVATGRKKLQQMKDQPPLQAVAEARATTATIKSGAAQAVESLRPTGHKTPDRRGLSGSAAEAPSAEERT